MSSQSSWTWSMLRMRSLMVPAAGTDKHLHCWPSARYTIADIFSEALATKTAILADSTSKLHIYNLTSSFISTKMAKITQDLPPEGGFRPITYAKNVPKRGPSGIALFAASIGIVAYGFSRVIKGNQQRRRLFEEQSNARMALTPTLAAEQDRLLIRRQSQRRLAEEKVMQDVPGWNIDEKFYNVDQYVARAQPSSVPKAM
eukprot:m.221289 g.221289  ORF g.221289 m.221289 type:complete len:201 (-) comp17246_c0_seq1:4500-5102(-)